MKNRYKIKYTSLYRYDLRNIISYITYELKNPIAAESLLNKIEKAIFNRSKNPTFFENFKINLDSEFMWYRIYVGNFIIYYTVDENVMTVRRICYRKSIIKDFE